MNKPAKRFRGFYERLDDIKLNYHQYDRIEHILPPIKAPRGCQGIRGLHSKLFSRDQVLVETTPDRSFLESETHTYRTLSSIAINFNSGIESSIQAELMTLTGTLGSLLVNESLIISRLISFFDVVRGYNQVTELLSIVTALAHDFGSKLSCDIIKAVLQTFGNMTSEVEDIESLFRGLSEVLYVARGTIKANFEEIISTMAPSYLNNSQHFIRYFTAEIISYVLRSSSTEKIMESLNIVQKYVLPEYLVETLASILFEISKSIDKSVVENKTIGVLLALTDFQEFPANVLIHYLRKIKHKIEDWSSARVLTEFIRNQNNMSFQTAIRFQSALLFEEPILQSHSSPHYRDSLGVFDSLIESKEISVETRIMAICSMFNTGVVKADLVNWIVEVPERRFIKLSDIKNASPSVRYWILKLFKLISDRENSELNNLVRRVASQFIMADLVNPEGDDLFLMELLAVVERCGDSQVVVSLNYDLSGRRLEIRLMLAKLGWISVDDLQTTIDISSEWNPVNMLSMSLSWKVYNMPAQTKYTPLLGLWIEKMAESRICPEENDWLIELLLQPLPANVRSGIVTMLDMKVAFAQDLADMESDLANFATQTIYNSWIETLTSFLCRQEKFDPQCKFGIHLMINLMWVKFEPLFTAVSKALGEILLDSQCEAVKDYIVVIGLRLWDLEITKGDKVASNEISSSQVTIISDIRSKKTLKRKFVDEDQSWETILKLDQPFESIFEIVFHERSVSVCEINRVDFLTMASKNYPRIFIKGVPDSEVCYSFIFDKAYMFATRLVEYRLEGSSKSNYCSAVLSATLKALTAKGNVGQYSNFQRLLVSKVQPIAIEPLLHNSVIDFCLADHHPSISNELKSMINIRDFGFTSFKSKWNKFKSSMKRTILSELTLNTLLAKTADKKRRAVIYKMIFELVSDEEAMCSAYIHLLSVLVSSYMKLEGCGDLVEEFTTLKKSLTSKGSWHHDDTGDYFLVDNSKFTLKVPSKYYGSFSQSILNLLVRHGRHLADYTWFWEPLVISAFNSHMRVANHKSSLEFLKSMFTIFNNFPEARDIHEKYFNSMIWPFMKTEMNSFVELKSETDFTSPSSVLLFRILETPDLFYLVESAADMLPFMLAYMTKPEVLQTWDSHKTRHFISLALEVVNKLCIRADENVGKSLAMSLALNSDKSPKKRRYHYEESSTDEDETDLLINTEPKFDLSTQDFLFEHIQNIFLTISSILASHSEAYMKSAKNLPSLAFMASLVRSRKKLLSEEWCPRTIFDVLVFSLSEIALKKSTQVMDNLVSLLIDAVCEILPLVPDNSDQGNALLLEELYSKIIPGLFRKLDQVSAREKIGQLEIFLAIRLELGNEELLRNYPEIISKLKNCFQNTTNTFENIEEIINPLTRQKAKSRLLISCTIFGLNHRQLSTLGSETNEIKAVILNQLVSQEFFRKLDGESLARMSNHLIDWTLDNDSLAVQLACQGYWQSVVDIILQDYCSNENLKFIIDMMLNEVVPQSLEILQRYIFDARTNSAVKMLKTVSLCMNRIRDRIWIDGNYPKEILSDLYDLSSKLRSDPATEVSCQIEKLSLEKVELIHLLAVPQKESNAFGFGLLSANISSVDQWTLVNVIMPLSLNFTLRQLTSQEHHKHVRLDIESKKLLTGVITGCKTAAPIVSAVQMIVSKIKTLGRGSARLTYVKVLTFAVQALRNNFQNDEMVIKSFRSNLVPAMLRIALPKHEEGRLDLCSIGAAMCLVSVLPGEEAATIYPELISKFAGSLVIKNIEHHITANRVMKMVVNCIGSDFIPTIVRYSLVATKSRLGSAALIRCLHTWLKMVLPNEPCQDQIIIKMRQTLVKNLQDSISLFTILELNWLCQQTKEDSLPANPKTSGLNSGNTDIGISTQLRPVMQSVLCILATWVEDSSVVTEKWMPFVMSLFDPMTILKKGASLSRSKFDKNYFDRVQAYIQGILTGVTRNHCLDAVAICLRYLKIGCIMAYSTGKRKIIVAGSDSLMADNIINAVCHDTAKISKRQATFTVQPGAATGAGLHHIVKKKAYDIGMSGEMLCETALRGFMKILVHHKSFIGTEQERELSDCVLEIYKVANKKISALSGFLLRELKLNGADIIQRRPVEILVCVMKIFATAYQSMAKDNVDDIICAISLANMCLALPEMQSMAATVKEGMFESIHSVVMMNCSSKNTEKLKTAFIGLFKGLVQSSVKDTSSRKELFSIFQIADELLRVLVHTAAGKTAPIIRLAIVEVVEKFIKNPGGLGTWFDKLLLQMKYPEESGRILVMKVLIDILRKMPKDAELVLLPILILCSERLCDTDISDIERKAILFLAGEVFTAATNPFKLLVDLYHMEKNKDTRGIPGLTSAYLNNFFADTQKTPKSHGVVLVPLKAAMHAYLTNCITEASDLLPYLKVPQIISAENAAASQAITAIITTIFDSKAPEFWNEWIETQPFAECIQTYFQVLAESLTKPAAVRHVKYKSLQALSTCLEKNSKHLIQPNRDLIEARLMKLYEAEETDENFFNFYVSGLAEWSLGITALNI